MEEINLRGEVHVEVEQGEEFPLEIEELFYRITVVSDFDEITQMRNVGFVVLAGQRQRRDAEQLEVLARHRAPLQVAVDHRHRLEERLALELVALVDVHDPLDQNDVHLLVDVRLVAQRLVRVALSLKILQDAVLVDAHVLGVGVLDRHVVFGRRRGRLHRERNPLRVELLHLGRLAVLAQHLLQRLAPRSLLLARLGEAGLGHVLGGRAQGVRPLGVERGCKIGAEDSLGRLLESDRVSFSRVGGVLLVIIILILNFRLSFGSERVSYGLERCAHLMKNSYF